MSHSFVDYLMYDPPNPPNQPPNSNQYVPLATFSWSKNGLANIPPSDKWADYVSFYGSDSAGGVNPNTTTNFTGSNAFPIWTTVDALTQY